MNNSQKKQASSSQGYTAEEFDALMNAVYAKYGISAKKREEQPETTSKPKVYEIKMIPPQPNSQPEEKNNP
jgi:hypothetical protein